MKKIPLVHALPKIIAIAFVMLISITSARAQNVAVGFTDAANVTSDNTSLTVYPNPVADEAKLVFNSSKYNVPYQVRIVNNGGIQLKNIEGTTVQGQNTLRIHVGNYPPGIYYVQLLTASGRETLKLLKQPLNSF